MDDFEAFLTGPKVNTDAPPSDFDLFLSGEQQASSIKQSMTAVDAQDLTPDQAAEAKALAKKTGIPRVAVEATLPDVKKQAQRLDLLEAAKTRPEIARMFSDPNVAKIAHDDVGPLSAVWDATTNAFSRAGLRTKQMAYQIGAERSATRAEDTPRGFLDILKDSGKDSPGLYRPDDVAGAAFRYLDSRISMAMGIDEADVAQQRLQTVGEISDQIAATPMSPAASRMRDAAIAAEKNGGVGEMLKTVASDPLGTLAFIGETGIEAMPQLAAMMAATVITRNPVAGMAVMGGLSGATERYTAPADFLKDKGVNLSDPAQVTALLKNPALLDEAKKFGFTRGAIIGAIDAASGGLAGKALMKSPLGNMVAQTIAQGAAGGGGEAAAQLATTGKVNASDVLFEALGEFFTAPMEVATLRGEYKERDRAKQAQAAQKIVADEAVDQSAGLDKIVEAATATKTLQRDPETLAAFVGKVAERTGVETIYIPAEKLVEYYQSQNLELPSTIEQSDVDTALATGGDVAIPLSTYVAEIGPEHHKGLRQYVRMSEQSMTLEESEAWHASIDEIVAQEDEALRGEMDRGRAAAEPAARVHKALREQLVAAGNAPDVAEKLASAQKAFFETNAKRLGTDAWTEYERSGLSVKREMSGPAIKNIEQLDIDIANLLATKDKRARTPVLDILRSRGGVAPGSMLAGELKARGVTPKTHPGLFKKGGQGAADNIVISEHEALAKNGFQEDGTGNYADQGAILAAIDSELAGNPLDDGSTDADRETYLANLDEYLSKLGMTVGMNTPEEIKAAVKADQDARAGEAEGDLYQITPEVARSLNYETKLPADPVFAEAVKNTPGASITKDGLLIDLVRFQKPEQEGAQAVRTGVFYLPAGSKATRHYRNGNTTASSNSYGGTEKFQGETLIRRPLFVKGATGGKAPEAAYEAVKGKGSFKKLEADVMHSATGLTALSRDLKIESIQKVLGKYGADRNLAYEIYANSQRGNQMRYAVQENIIAHVVRDAGYDSVVGYSKGKAGSFISEVFDVRELTYPAQGMDSEVHEAYYQQNQDGARGSFTPATNVIKLFESANLSTFLHESGHFWLEMMGSYAQRARTQLAAHEAAVAEDVPIGKLDDAQIDGLRSIIADHDAILKHLGADPAAKLTTEQHEEFARTVEAYFMTGKAPSVELQSAFRSFTTWLVAIYKDIKNLRVKLNPEISGVLDRMLATSEEIAHAEKQAKFEAIAIPGATPTEAAALNRLHEAATGEAERKLLVKMMEPVRREREAWWKEEWIKTADTVRAAMEQEPRWRAMSMVRGSEGVEPVKLDRKVMEDTFGSGIKDLLPRGATAKNGVDPDLFAEQVGLPNARALVDALASVKDVRLKDAVKAETDRLMNERHGDMLNDGSIEAAALEAIHNEKRGDAIAMQLKILRREAADARRIAERRVVNEGAFEPQAYASEAAVAETGLERLIAKETGRVAQVARAYDRSGRKKLETAMDGLDPKAIREAARRVVGLLKTKDLGKTAQYSRAELRFAEEAKKAIAKRDFEAAALATYRQLLNHWLFIETKAAQVESEKIVKYLSGLASKKTIPTMDQDYLDQIHGLLEKYDLKAASQKEVERRKSFAAWAAEQEAAGRDVIASDKLRNLSQTTHYSSVSLDDMRGLRDAVKQVEHFGRLKQKLADLQEERDYNEVVTGAVDQIYGLGKSIKERVNVNPNKRDLLKSGIRGIDAELLKIEQLVDWLDGGNPNGYFNRIAFRRLAAAEAHSNDLSLKYSIGVEKIMGKLDPKRMQERLTIPGVYTRDGVLRVWNRADLMAVALNMGNEENLFRLTAEKGNNLTPENLNAITAQLNKTEVQAVQETWDLVNSLWPEIEALEKRLNGVAPPKVEKQTVTMQTADGPVTLEGGYYPIVYDPEKSNTASKHEEKKNASSLMENNYIKATTRRGHVKERQAGVARALKLDMNILPQHLSQVTHDLAYREAVMDVDRFMSDNRIHAAISEAMGKEYADLFRPWLQSIANDQNINPLSGTKAEKFARKLRTNATIVGLGFRASTGLAQIAGLSASAEVIGMKWVGAGMKQFAGTPKQMGAVLDQIMAESGEMRHRHNQMDRDMRDGYRAMLGHKVKKLEGEGWARAAIREVMSAKFSGVANDVKEASMAHISMMDKAVAVPTYLGAKAKALSEGMSEADAIAYGEKAVRLSQGSGAAKDLSSVQRGSEYMKWFMMFYSYFNVLYARQRNLARDAGNIKTAGDFGNVFARGMWLMIVPAIASELLTGKGPDEDEDWLAWGAKKAATYPFMSMPFVRDIVQGATGDFGYKMSPMARVFETGIKMAQGTDDLFTGDGDAAQKAVKNTLLTAGYAFGLPTGAPANSVDYLWDVIDGDQRPEDVLEFARGMTLGPKKK